MKERMKFFIFSTLVRLNMNNFVIKKPFHMFLELEENTINIKLVFNQIEPSETTISINKAHIKTMSTDRNLGRAPNIGINDL
jgi:hypothetical protein